MSTETERSMQLYYAAFAFSKQAEVDAAEAMNEYHRLNDILTQANRIRDERQMEMIAAIQRNGLPTETITESKKLSESVESTVVPDVVVKRGPGRPPKNRENEAA